MPPCIPENGRARRSGPRRDGSQTRRHNSAATARRAARFRHQSAVRAGNRNRGHLTVSCLPRRAAQLSSIRHGLWFAEAAIQRHGEAGWLRRLPPRSRLGLRKTSLIWSSSLGSARRMSHRSVWRFTLVWSGPSTWILRGNTNSIGSSYGSAVYKFAENSSLTASRAVRGGRGGASLCAVVRRPWLHIWLHAFAPWMDGSAKGWQCDRR